jgi:hypothetical protein
MNNDDVTQVPKLGDRTLYITFLQMGKLGINIY